MKFAILADIHGNALALQAVLSDMDARAIPLAVNLGDHFSGPLDAAETARLLRARAFPSIRGNHDRHLLEQRPEAMGPSDRVAFEQLTRADLDWLATLPPTATLFGDVFLCHGTPRRDDRYWLDRVGADGQLRPASLAEVEAEARDVTAGLFLCAHTHIPRCLRLRDGRVVVNPGSVGCPGYDDDQPVHHHVQTGTPNASYAIAERREGGAAGPAWDITFRSVPYAADAAAKLALANGRPDWARALATGWFEA